MKRETEDPNQSPYQRLRSESDAYSYADNEHSYNEGKAEKNRERNREHAKRTRLRKKVMIEGMKIRLLELQREVSIAVGILSRNFKLEYS